MSAEKKQAVEFKEVEGAVSDETAEKPLTKALRSYDGDGDGKLSDLERICMKYDTNNDGNFSMLEVEAIVKDMQTAQKEAKNMGRLALAVAIVGLLFCGALLGLMFAANEASKESHVKGSVLVDLSGNPTQTKPVSSVVTLIDLPKLPTKVLDEIKHVAFTAYRTKNNANMPISKEKSIKEFGEISMRVNIDGYAKSNAAVTLKTAEGPLVVSSNGSAPQYNDHQIIITEPARRLSEEHGKQARLYASVDELQTHERRHGRHLQGGGQFAPTVSVATVSVASATYPLTSLEKSLDINQKVYIAGNSVLGDGAGYAALHQCQAFAASHVVDPAAPAVKVCGTGIKVTIFLRGRCEGYYEHSHVVGKCDYGGAADTCDSISPAQNPNFGHYQSYLIEPC